MTENKRLLGVDETAAIIKQNQVKPSGFKEVIDALKQAQDSATLKAVGEWLEGLPHAEGMAGQRMIKIRYVDLQALKEGRMIE